jgi:hypothetical protein
LQTGPRGWVQQKDLGLNKLLNGQRKSLKLLPSFLRSYEGKERIHRMRVTYEMLTDLEDKMRHHLEAWRIAKDRRDDIEQELLDIEINTRLAVIDAVMSDKKEGVFGVFQPGDRTIADFAQLELRKNERWQKLRQESDSLQSEIDFHRNEFELLSHRVQVLPLMATLPNSEPKVMRAN